MSNFDKENKKIVLPPPPKASKSNINDNKLKLKRVHTISGGSTTTTTNIGGGNITNDDAAAADVVVGGVGGVCGRNIQQETYSIINPIESCSSANLIMTAAATTTATSIDSLQQQQQSSTMINNNNNVDNRSNTTPPTMKLNQDPIKMDDEDDDVGGGGFVEIKAPKTADDQIRIDQEEEEYFDQDEDDDGNDLWTMTSEQQKYYVKQFNLLQKNSYGNIQGNVAKVFFEKSGLEVKELSHIWKISDLDEDGQLSLPEFCIAMHLVVLRRNKVELPDTLPLQLKNYYLNCSATLNGSSMIGQSLLDQNNSVEMLNLDVDNEAETNPEIDHHNQNRNQRNSQPNWTRFNDSPNGLLLIKDEIEYQSSSSNSGSPTKLANFDYDINYIASNPNIKHPVALRISPTSPALSSIEQINIDDLTNAAEKFSIHSSPSIDSIETIDYVNKPQPFFPVSQTTSDEILKQSLLINQEPNDCDLFKKIVDHVKNIEMRFCRMNPIKGNLFKTNIQQENNSDSDKIEELKKIIQTMDRNRRILLQQNYQLYQDVGGLLKIVNYLFETQKNSQPNSLATVSEKSDNNDFGSKNAKI